VFDYNTRKLILCKALQEFSRYCTRLMVKRSGKGNYCRKAQNHPEECQFQGRKFAFRAENSAPRAGISAPGQKFWGPEILEFLALRNSAKSFTKRCGATFSKGARNSGLAEFPGARNFIIFGPQKFG
jgi:hypothetical protein